MVNLVTTTQTTQRWVTSSAFGQGQVQHQVFTVHYQLLSHNLYLIKCHFVKENYIDV